MANATVHLFKSDFHPTPASVVADFAANECDFDGYAAITIATWGDVVVASGNAGYALLGVLCTFLWALAVDAVGNNVGGWWVQTAGGALRNYFEFPAPVTLSGPDMAVTFTPVVPIYTGLQTG